MLVLLVIAGEAGKSSHGQLLGLSKKRVSGGFCPLRVGIR
jgi:hypothetical protein